MADLIEARVFHYARKLWYKTPDKPLRFVVERALVGRRRFQEEEVLKMRSGQDDNG